MKTLIFVLAILTLFGGSQPLSASAASESGKTYYAKVLSENTHFYSKSGEIFEDKFILPNSFFVLLIGEEDEYYQAKYLDLFGYVKKNEVIPMDGTPSNPYPNNTFRARANGGLEVYSAPRRGATVIGNLDFLQDGILKYGEITGDELISYSTNKWFYCSFQQNGVTSQGYVFSYYCDHPVSSSENTEYFSEITGTLDFSPELPANGGLSDTVTAIIILSVSLPCLIVLYLLLSPAKRRKVKTEKAKSPVRIKRGKDYYEFNEDDL